ncbi:proton channel otopetrin-like c [Musca autumnalis]|uniref:proton channel otopetrin-like c n=1 Tax=Musca autumnalis TaxID=221902 RepID=UPI003CF7E0A0
MDSSPDLSLKLRRGSSDSRDNFYMDFAQGIDSDIEEVDNTALDQATAPPLPLVGDGMDYMVIPPPPPPSVMTIMQQQQTMGLPTVSEHDDTPPTPPPQMTTLPSPPVSPTTSVLEMMPPPPLSPPPTTTSTTSSIHSNRALPQPPSPPLETEDEEDDDDVEEEEDDEEAADADIEATDKETPDEETDDKETDGKETEGEDDNDGDDEGDKDSPTPPLPPIPSHLAYNRPAAPAPSSHEDDDDEDDSHLPKPMQGQTPSTSPSPPVTPPPCPELSSIQKIVSPPPTHVSQIPPLTPPSESDQSQPNSPPPISKHSPLTMPSTPPPPPECDVVDDEQPPTPPPEFDQQDEPEEPPPAKEEEVEDEPEIDLSGVSGEPSMDLVQEVLQEAAQKAINGEENKSSRDDDSTTITTPPTNGYSASSMYNHQPEEAMDDQEQLMANIPPPAGLEDPVEDEDGTKTPVSETKPLDLDELSSDRAPPPPPLQEEGDEEEKPASMPGTPTSQVSQLSQPTPTPTVSGSPKRKSSVTSATGGGGGGGSRVPSRSVSRSGSRSGSRTASRSGSIRGGAGGSIGSRAGSIAAASVASAAASIVSASQSVKADVITSPPISLKSIRSPPGSIRSHTSKHSPSLSQKSHHTLSGEPKASPTQSNGSVAGPPPARLQSPPEGDSPPAMPSPPIIRSPPQVKSPPSMHSPPRVTSPPKVYSPQLISSPPMHAGDIDPEKAEKPTATDSLPSTSSSASTSDTRATASSALTAAAATTTSLSYRDEQPQAIVSTAQKLPTGRQMSSHHHYHLPHQFQHPHHQNHHPHSHGVAVPTPTVPASYTSSSLLHESRHIRAASSSGDEAMRPAPPPASLTSPATTATTLTPSTNLLVSPETVSHTSSVSPAKLSARIRESGSQHRVTIDESNLPVASQLSCGGGDGGGGGGEGGNGSGPPSPGASSQQQLTGDERQTGHLALMYHSSQLSSYPVLPAIKRTHRPSFIYPPMPRVKKSDALATLFSALYGKILVVMGIAFPMAEVISTYIPPSFYEVYYLYLYIGSMIFLLFMYATLLWGRPKIPTNIASPTKLSAKTRSTSASESMDESDTSDSTSTHRNKRMPPAISSARRPSLLSPLGRQHHYGSFYLRMGAVAFGIGSMIYSGLEFGQYFELNPDTKCHNVLLALTPATRMAFIFIQMYFIFLNNEQIKVYRYKIIARFGLMHMIGTNLAVWLNVLIQETKHEILTFYNPENRTLRISHRIPGHSRAHSVLAPSDPNVLLRVPRGLKGPYQIFECRRTNILGTLVQDASPFLFPCTIEYSLICAAILYVMWKSISRPQIPKPQRPDMISSPIKRSPHHYSVDCARAHKGLFVGILILVLTIISLILFFVLISRPDFVALAVMEVTICELFIYGTATIATLVGMIQIRHLQYDAYRSFSLDDILLVGAQTGSFLYNIFTVIAGHFSLRSDDWLVPLNALASIVQTACQTMFILDASRRQAVTPEHMRKKPGREIVTFMLVVNLAMWAISTLEKSRAESHPIQLNFYGLWAWTIITHVSMPLAIFYRFHSTVCLCEIWKRAYKLKPTYM